MLKNYLFYYYLSFYFINQNNDDFEFLGIDHYRYFELKLSIFSPQKTRLPALVIKFILFGFGFEFCTHGKK